MFRAISLVDLQKNSELIKYYLQYLKLRREEEIANYQPSDWELLSKEEQLQIATHHAACNLERDQELQLEAQILINQYNRENLAKKKLSTALWKSQQATTSKLILNSPTLEEFFLTKIFCEINQ